ncbi:amidohydrolase family protein [Peristeroidobacter agariperforans]|uniref:amidohydrolase family protein n=1 Tax=Peristeroidobacter agariperforans TaxID=268404 RepID=UPI00101C46FF|nr:amidohydrolase family protein [Peristeroidobacter agariperforans]
MWRWCKRSTLLAVLLLKASLVPTVSLAVPTAVFTQATPPAGAIAIVGASVVNVEDGSVIPNAVVLIEGDRIKAVGPASTVNLPADVQKIRMDGKWLAPGLMNMHTHFGLKLPGPAGAALENETEMQLVLRMADNARQSLYAGVTTVRLVGEEHGSDFALKAAIDGGTALGPRIQTAGAIIATTGGHGFVEADGVAELSKAVRTQIKNGATWIKVAISGGISDSHGSIAASTMTHDEMKAVIEVAHRNGAKVTAHNGSPVAADEALELGIDCFEHAYHLTEKQLRTMKAKGAWLVPTAVVTDEGAMEFFRKIGSPPWYLERVKSTRVDHLKMLQTAVKLGVNIALGTDQFPFEPNAGTTATVREAELYVTAGMTPLQALQAATLKPATMLEMDKEVGSLKPGHYADIIAVNANPAQDIAALRTINFVMKGGQVVRHDQPLP